MDALPPLATLVQRLRDGDPQAAEALFAGYARRLARLAGEHLSRKLAARLDPEDVVQSVFRTFFRRAAEGEFLIDSSGQLWRLLAQITVRKARALARQHTAARRDVKAETSAGDGLLAEAVSREPGPEEAAILVDQINTLLHGLPAQHCRILEMRLQGYEVAAIARALKMSRQMIYHVLRRFQKQLTDSCDGAA